MAIAFDASAGQTGATGPTATLTLTTGAIAKAYVVVGITCNDDIINSVTITSVTINGVAATLRVSAYSGGGATRRVYLYDAVMGTLSAGAKSIVVTTDENASYAMTAMSFSGVDQVSPRSGNTVSPNGSSAAPASGNLSSAVGEMALIITGWRGTGSVTNTPDATWTIPSGANAASTGHGNAAGYKAGAATVSRTDALSAAADWAVVGLGIIAANDTVTITNPGSNYVTWQRDGTSKTVDLAGTYTGNVTGIEASLNGSTYTTVDSSLAGGTWSGTLSVPQGQYTLTIRAINDTSVSATRTYFGVGIRIGCWGQSNMSGRGTSNQTYTHATLKATLYGNDAVHKELADPYDSNSGQVHAVSSDVLAAGSFMPLLATLLMAEHSVPVQFIPCARGGRAISTFLPAADHEDVTTLYGSGNVRCQTNGGVEVVIWWQGEDDAQAGTTQADYNSRLDTIANAVQTDLGVKLMACKLQNSTGLDDAAEAVIRAAVAEAWGDNANVLQGPDFSDITSEDDFHLQSNANLQEAADRWFAALEARVFSAGLDAAISDTTTAFVKWRTDNSAHSNEQIRAATNSLYGTSYTDIQPNLARLLRRQG